MATNYIVIPQEYRFPEGAYCSQCRAETHGQCGHFLDARDHHGPLEPMNWMLTLPFNRKAYLQWLGEHWNEVRFIQEHPDFWEGYPEGSLGTIPFLRNMVHGE